MLEIECRQNFDGISRKDSRRVLRRIFRKWVRILNLCQWRLKVEIVGPDELEWSKTELESDYVYKEAVIRLPSNAKAEDLDFIVCSKLVLIEVGSILEELRLLDVYKTITWSGREKIERAEEKVVKKLSVILCELVKNRAESYLLAEKRISGMKRRIRIEKGRTFRGVRPGKTQELLKETFAVAISILKLQGWKLELKIVPAPELEKNEADIDEDFTEKQALVRIAEDIEIRDLDLISYHEILHLVLGHIEQMLIRLDIYMVDREAKRFNRVEETATESLARVFCKILRSFYKKRRGRARPKNQSNPTSFRL